MRPQYSYSGWNSLYTAAVHKDIVSALREDFSTFVIHVGLLSHSMRINKVLPRRSTKAKSNDVAKHDVVYF